MKKTGIYTIFLLLMGNMAIAQFVQDKLPYAYDALEPYIDAETMEIHYSKHHASYVDNLNKAISGSGFEKQTLEQLLSGISKQNTAVRNNAGGHYNHNLFWTVLTPKRGTKPSEKLDNAIKESFSSFENFKSEINKAGSTRFGSGWAWAYVDNNGKLAISSTANQDNPLMDVVEERGTPILGIDVWEHAYYLKYKNKRGDYLGAIWNVINWEEVSKRYEDALNK